MDDELKNSAVGNDRLVGDVCLCIGEKIAAVARADRTRGKVKVSAMVLTRTAEKPPTPQVVCTVSKSLNPGQVFLPSMVHE